MFVKIKDYWIRIDSINSLRKFDIDEFEVYYIEINKLDIRYTDKIQRDKDYERLVKIINEKK